MTRLEDCVKELNLWVEMLSVGSSIVISIAAIVTAGAAVYGLTSWKKELSANAKFRVAADLKAKTRVLERKISYFREAQHSPSEYPPDYRLYGQKHTDEEKARALDYIYSNRWERLSPAIEDFDRSALEAEALLGDDLKPLCDVIIKALFEIKINIGVYLRHAIRPKTEHDRDIGNSASVVIEKAHDDQDPYSLQLRRKFQDLELHLDQFL